jgi:hypothetical protein
MRIRIRIRNPAGTRMIRCHTIRRYGIKKLYKGGKRNTLHVYTAGGVEAYTLHVHTAGGGKRYILHTHTGSGRKGYTYSTYGTLKVGNFDHLLTFKIVLKLFPNTLLQFFLHKNPRVIWYYFWDPNLNTRFGCRSTKYFEKKCGVVDLTLDRSNLDH